MVRDAVAVGVDDDRIGQAIVLVVSPKPGAGFEAAALLDELRGQLPLYMVLREIVPARAAPLPQRQVRPHCAPPGADRVSDERMHPTIALASTGAC